MFTLEPWEQLQRKQKSGAAFWFGDHVYFEVLDPTEPFHDGPVKDVLRASHSDWGFDGFVYVVEDADTGVKYYCRECQMRYPGERRSDHPEREAALEALRQQSYPEYYQTEQKKGNPDEHQDTSGDRGDPR